MQKITKLIDEILEIAKKDKNQQPIFSHKSHQKVRSFQSAW